MAPFKQFQDLRVWQTAYSLSLRVYQQSGSFPLIERFGLTSQLRRAATSVAANIAEGKGRRSVRDLLHFLSISKGSAQETICYLLMAKDLSYGQACELDRLILSYQGLNMGIEKYIQTLYMHVNKKSDGR